MTHLGSLREGKNVGTKYIPKTSTDIKTRPPNMGDRRKKGVGVYAAKASISYVPESYIEAKYQPFPESRAQWERSTEDKGPSTNKKRKAMTSLDNIFTSTSLGKSSRVPEPPTDVESCVGAWRKKGAGSSAAAAKASRAVPEFSMGVDYHPTPEARA